MTPAPTVKTFHINDLYREIAEAIGDQITENHDTLWTPEEGEPLLENVHHDNGCVTVGARGKTFRMILVPVC